MEEEEEEEEDQSEELDKEGWKRRLGMCWKEGMLSLL